MTGKNKQTIAVIGGGSFGTAIADICASNGHSVCIWLRDAEQARAINEQHINTRYLPDYRIHEAVRASCDLQAVVAAAEIVFIAIPSQSFRQVVRALGDTRGKYLISTTKGVEADSFALMSEILKAEHPGTPIGVLSGPNLAKEILAKAPTATVIASEDEGLCQHIQDVLHSSYFRVYTNHDLYGVELAGALKNIYAIISGMAAALGLGENTKSMLITRALAEMSRFAVQLGANPMTFLGLAGVGDLIATCASPLSRNYRMGVLLAQGKTPEEAAAEIGQTAEGINTLKLVYDKARQMEIYMPLVYGLYEVVFKGRSISEMSKRMMLREQKTDVEFSVLPGSQGSEA